MKINHKDSTLNVYELGFTCPEALTEILGFLRMFEGQSETVIVHNCAMMPELCRKLDVPYFCRHTEIGPIIFEYRKEKNPCSMCSKMRRGALNDLILERGFNKVALGHHFDDAVETFLMNLLYEGRIGCFEPVTYLSRTGVTQIRPMLYIGEQAVAGFARRMELPVVENVCPADKHTKRQEVKELIASLQQQYPDVKTKIFNSMQRLPLPQWEPNR